MALLHAVAGRIIARYLDAQRKREIVIRHDSARDGVDLTYEHLGRTVGVKIKADPYAGYDGAKCSDRTLPFYRPAGHEYALEYLAHHTDRTPGWARGSIADELFYYLLAIDQTEGEVAALLEASDDEFFEGIRIARDDLRVIPMHALQTWFESAQDSYPSRPIQAGDHSAWCRIVPMSELEAAVPGVVRVGPIFHA